MKDSGRTGLWGGRFEAPVHPDIHAFTGSLRFDRRLVRHDLLGSLAHARMLMEADILGAEEAGPILEGLSTLLREVEEGRLAVEGQDEDVHTWIERTLGERIGRAAGRLHAGRSRNDQTVLALRLWTREAIRHLAGATARLQRVWLEQADEHRETWLPGYTHLQRAQPVSLAHHLLAHVWSLEADVRRLRRAHEEAGVSPLGAGALAGSPLPLDPVRTAELLGLDAVHPNSLLAVADRDFAVETAFACALLMVHLSRWAEETVLWASREFGFLELDDTVAQGSSLMPQKKNPEAAELVRGKAGRAVGHVAALLSVLKGLPLAYNSDLQEDKEALFDAVDTALGSLGAAATLAGGVRWRPEHMREALREGHLTATDLADHLVGRGVPFREAHEQAGRAVAEAERRGVELSDLPAERLRALCPDAEPAAVAAVTPAEAGRARRTPSGTAPDRVEAQLASARARVEEVESWLAERPASPIERAHREGRLLAGQL